VSLHFFQQKETPETGEWKGREWFIVNKKQTRLTPDHIHLVCVSVSIHSSGSGVSGDEEDKDEDEELAHDDDEQDVDDMNHTHLPKEAVHAHSPSKRRRGAPVGQHLKRIDKYNLSDRPINADCTHICVYPLSDDEGGSKCYCNTSLKVVRGTKSVSSAWSTSTVVGHFKKNHPHSDSTRKQKGKLETRRVRLGECMHTSDGQSIQGLSSKKIPRTC
jgi:hypothetical protein